MERRGRVRQEQFAPESIKMGDSSPVVSLNLSRALGENLPDNSSQHHHTPVGSQHSDFSFLREEVPWLHREVIMMDKAALQRPVSNVISCRSCGV